MLSSTLNRLTRTDHTVAVRWMAVAVFALASVTAIHAQADRPFDDALAAALEASAFALDLQGAQGGFYDQVSATQLELIAIMPPPEAAAVEGEGNDATPISLPFHGWAAGSLGEVTKRFEDLAKTVLDLRSLALRAESAWTLEMPTARLEAMALAVELLRERARGEVEQIVSTVYEGIERGEIDPWIAEQLEWAGWDIAGRVDATPINLPLN